MKTGTILKPPAAAGIKALVKTNPVGLGYMCQLGTCPEHGRNIDQCHESCPTIGWSHFRKDQVELDPCETLEEALIELELAWSNFKQSMPLYRLFLWLSNLIQKIR